MEAVLPGKVSAGELAAAALERGSLLDYYDPGFLGKLRSATGNGAVSTVGEWIGFGERRLPDGVGKGDEVYLVLVLESEEVAREFCRARPASAGFERICKSFTDRLSHEDKEQWDDRVGVSPTLGDRKRAPSMAQAIDSGEAEFSLLSEARCFQHAAFLPGQRAANRTYERFYLPLRGAFETTHGRIVEELWCHKIPLGVVLTTGGSTGNRLHFDGVYSEKLGEVINRCKDVHGRARRFLPPEEYRTLAGEMYGVLTDLFGHTDESATLGVDGSSTYDVDGKPYLERMDLIESKLERGMTRRGERWYLAGTVIGLASLSVLFGVLALLSLGDWEQIFEGAIFGAAGALASVLYRMHRGELSIDAQQGRLLVYIAASVRPLTGALFGGAIIALLLSGLLPIEVPEDDSDRFYFLGVLAFIAGLSERWAPDLLQLTADQISAEAKPDEGTEDEEAESETATKPATGGGS